MAIEQLRDTVTVRTADKLAQSNKEAETRRRSSEDLFSLYEGLGSNFQDLTFKDFCSEQRTSAHSQDDKLKNFGSDTPGMDTSSNTRTSVSVVDFSHGLTALKPVDPRFDISADFTSESKRRNDMRTTLSPSREPTDRAYRGQTLNVCANSRIVSLGQILMESSAESPRGRISQEASFQSESRSTIRTMKSHLQSESVTKSNSKEGPLRLELSKSSGVRDSNHRVRINNSTKKDAEKKVLKKIAASPKQIRVAEHTDNCSTCNKYVYFCKTRCLVCGKCYCHTCVKEAMGDKLEGRKCKTCLGHLYNERYIERAGRGCFGMTKLIREIEVKWAKRKPPIILVDVGKFQESHVNQVKSYGSPIRNPPNRQFSPHGGRSPGRACLIEDIKNIHY
eukprot:c8817_g1_i1 orf=444-1619(+)